MLMDRYLPSWEFDKKKECSVQTETIPKASVVYDVDFGKSFIIRTLFFLRGIPTGMLTLNDFIDNGFILLEESEHEIVIGLVAQPWTLKGNIVEIPREEFRNFHMPDYVKVVWNFSFEPIGKGRTKISTETRIHCTSHHAKKKFSPYWFVIGYFSGVIRREMLAIIHREVMKNNC
ncbi:hypothetical protein [Desmospora profundinema]|uniref:Uncharacterized protein n=1 Tax=Desmospora profundinema TaxID=1571184 RepID=A0ABU1INH4_9BACL|nr:hypothetical protein [Desmospora profundinema]MDR6226251.1 hypothetical protein [Desmospora profundinema]